MDHKLTFANGKRAVYSTVGGLQPARLVDVGTGLKQKSGPDVNIMPPLQVEVREPSKLSNNVQRYRAIHDTFNILSLNQRVNTETSTRLSCKTGRKLYCRRETARYEPPCRLESGLTLFSNDTERRAASLRQLSLFFHFRHCTTFSMQFQTS